MNENLNRFKKTEGKFLDEYMKMTGHFPSYSFENNFFTEHLTEHLTSRLDEGLIHTYNEDLAIKYVIDICDGDLVNDINVPDMEHGCVFSDDGYKEFKKDKDVFSNVDFDNINVSKILFKLPKIVYDTQKDTIENAMELCGYHYANYDLAQDKRIITLRYEKKFYDKEKSWKEYPFLYHMTPYYFVDRIDKVGLYPKAINTEFTYPSRIYVCTNIKHMILLGPKICEKNFNEKNNGKYYLYKIDTSKLSDNTVFRYDPNFAGSLYTEDNMPKEALTKVRSYQYEPGEGYKLQKLINKK